MHWSEIFIRRNVLTWMIMVGLIFFGLVSYQSIGISQFPDVDFPVVSISISREGSSPLLNEIEIADEVESAITAVQGIKKITSTSRTGSVEVVAEFDIDKNIDVAVQDIQAVLSRIQRNLPEDIDAPVIRKTNPEDSPIVWIGISSETMSRYELMGFVRDQIQPQFSTIDGVADISLGGYVDPNLRVEVDSQKLTQYDLTVVDLINSIQSEHTELPAGRIEAEREELNVRTYGEATSIEDFKKLPILKRGGSPNFTPLRVGDIANVEFGLLDNRSRARAMGNPSVGLGIRKQRGVNAVQVADLVKEKLKGVQQQYKDQVQLSVNFDSTVFIKDAIHELFFTLSFAAFLTAIVCFLFLGTFSSTFNVVLAIPTAIIGSLIFINAFDFTLNTFTLLALSMSVGIVVDDAIMVLENMTRHQHMKKPAYEAAVDGTKEIFLAVLATTASLLAIFLPVTYVDGVIGKYLLQFGATLSIAVFLSLIEAVTLTPMRFAQFQKGDHAEKDFLKKIMDPLQSFYHSSLKTVLNRSWFFIFTSFVVFLLSLVAVKFVPKEFTPYQDVSRIMLLLRAPLGVSIQYMDEKFKLMEDALMKNPSVERYFGFVGGSTVNQGRIFVTLKGQKQRDKKQNEIAKDFREEFGQIQGVKVIVQDNANSGFSSGRGFPVEFSILGPNFEQLSTISSDFVKKMQDSGVMTDVDSSFREGLPEVQIYPNRDAALLRGVSVVDVNKTVQALIGGVKVGRYTNESYRYDIRVRLKESDRMRSEDILKLKVRNNRSELIELKDVVTLKKDSILQEITRDNRQRAITLTANLAPGASQDKALNVVKQWEKDLPQGYRIQFSGSSEAFSSAFQGLIIAMLLGLIVTYMVLGSQFNSFIQPLLILLAIPFSLSGAFLALLVFGQSLNIYSMIGILLVLGLVLKNSIMLVDFTNQKKKEGLTTFEALQAACPLRLRPIIMTSVATIMGALPAALALGPGAEALVPMSLTVIGGMLVSTIFTLYIVPAVYLKTIK